MSEKKVEFTLERTVGASRQRTKEEPFGPEKYPYDSKAAVFPEGFLWASGMAANQAEGGYDEGGRGLSNVDVVPFGEKRIEIATGQIVNVNFEIGDYFPSHKAADMYHHYKEDVALMKEAGLNAHKLSISWSRIFPCGDEEIPNEAGLAYYESFIDECLKNGIEPILEITHWDQPLEAIKKYGGWKNRKFIDLYLKLVKALVDRVGNKINYWLTIHESDCLTSYAFLVAGIYKESDETFGQDKLNAAHNMFVASAKAKAMIKKAYPKAKVGAMVGLTFAYPYSCKPIDVLASHKYAQMSAWMFADVLCRGYYPGYAKKEFERIGLTIPYVDGDDELLKSNTLEFILFSYYNSLTTKAGSLYYYDNPFVGNSMDPMGLRIILNRIYDRYQIPVMLGEIAIKTKDTLEDGKIHDTDRSEFLKAHIKAIKDTICEDGSDIMGCLFWEFVDNVSVSKGKMTDRYGLVYVDADDKGNGTYNRYKKDSFYAIKEVIENKGANL